MNICKKTVLSSFRRGFFFLLFRFLGRSFLALFFFSDQDHSQRENGRVIEHGEEGEEKDVEQGCDHQRRRGKSQHRFKERG